MRARWSYVEDVIDVVRVVTDLADPLLDAKWTGEVVVVVGDKAPAP
jgi:hypothetical protein